METTTCFETPNANCYLYDGQSQHIVTIHPAIQLIAEKESNSLMDEKGMMGLIHREFPDLNNSDILFYIKKYQFLKENNFFKKEQLDDLLSARLTAQTVESQLANTDHLLFQVTADCNLECHYCCYGELYKNPDSSQSGSLSFEQAKSTLDYLVPYWNSNINISHKNKIIIGFYGGEPLVNFALIQQVVEYVKQIKLKNQATFIFNMTTNGLLLNRYMDFLVANDFSILLSLDGNEVHDYLRVDKKNKPTFKRVYANIKELQTKYPIYFEKQVEFNSLLNNQSTPESVYNFIHEEFNKTPMIGTLSSNGLKPDRVEDFRKIFQPYSESMGLKKLLGSRSAKNKSAGYFFYYHLTNAYRQYYEIMLTSKKQAKKIPTGTCLPFWKKMYISASGNIYACERIGLEHILGTVHESVNLDFEKIATLYNGYFDFLTNQCTKCYLADFCSECMFQFDFVNGSPVCNKQQSLPQFKAYLATIVSNLEEEPTSFDDINQMTFA